MGRTYGFDVRPFAAGLLLAAFLVAGCASGRGQPSGDPPGADAEAAAQEEDDTPFEEWSEVLEDTREIEGYFTFHLKRDNTLYLEVDPERLGTDFGMLAHYSRGLGDLFVQEGLPASGGTELLRLRRSGDELYLVRRNPRFTADEGSAMEASMEENVGHSVLAAFEIEGRHDSTGHLLVDATDFFVSDYANTSATLEAAYGDHPVTFDGDRSYVERVQGFPENVEIDAFLTYASGDPPAFGGPGLSDFRSIPIGIRYSIFALPEEPMERRPADLRVGHFMTAQQDFSRDQATDPYHRYVHRWRLEKTDHDRETAPPVEPIVYYIDRSVPERYRPHVREGIEAWNEAFRAAGFEDAVEARLAPDDSTWSAEDVRYSTVRWTAAHNMGYAIGPSQVDPRSGEILNADILISSEFVQGWLRTYEELVAAPGARGGESERASSAAERSGPAGLLLRHREAQEALARTRPEALPYLCMAESFRSQQMGTLYAVLAARGLLESDGEMPEEYFGAALKDLIMHEVGHTLGLRHNFRGSTDIPNDRLHDRDYTREHGVSLSVMEYAPVNLALDESEQGHYFNPSVGAYDEWAVTYAYVPLYEQPADGPVARSGSVATTPEARSAVLSKIAGLSDDPHHAYATDEDARFGPFAVDPSANTGDLGSDPLLWARDRQRLVESVMPELSDRLVAEGESWHRLRDGVTSLYFTKWVALMPATKAVGGLYVSRDHKGQPGARPPFRPVPAERQREALDLLAEEAFSEDAFGADPTTLNRLAPDLWFDWRRSFTGMLPLDYPVHRQVLVFQRFLLQDLLHPERLHRVVDNQLRTPDGVEPFTLGELFATLTDAVWSEVARSGSPREVASVRRNLQRAHLERLEALLLRESMPGIGGEVTVPHDARALARAELTELGDRLERATRADGGLTRESRAHLEESRARIDRALEASLTMSADD